MKCEAWNGEQGARSTLHAPPSTLPQGLTEAQLREVWARQLLDGGPLVDSLRRRLQVVYPGRRPGGPGPDFQGAVLALDDGTLNRGDVEVHLSPAAWWAHGHQADPAYDRVVLHVVLRDGRGQPARRANGEAVPTLVLEGRLALPVSALARRLQVDEPTVGAEACLDSAEALLGAVDRAGLERFLDKAARFEADLAALPADHVLLRGVLVALGYSANKGPCARLADLVCWEALATAEERDARAILLGGAGLLPSQRGLTLADDEASDLEPRWARLSRRDGLVALAPGGWQFAGARPEGFPTRRLAGGARLLAGWAGQSPAEELARAVLEAGPRPARLAERFRVAERQGYWGCHYDFGAPTAGARPWLVGGPRATEIVVNIALPFCYALGRASERPGLSAAALIAYRRYPAGPWNRVSLQMAAQLFGPRGRRQAASAARQQGLLHLFHRWCWERRCETCPAGARRRAHVFS